MTKDELAAAAEEIAKKLTDSGCLIEAGWQILAHTSVPPDAPKEQKEDLRMAFFLGAQHLFASLIGVLDGEEEITEADMQRMDHISTELEQFRQEYVAKARRQHN